MRTTLIKCIPVILLFGMITGLAVILFFYIIKPEQSLLKQSTPTETSMQNTQDQTIIVQHGEGQPQHAIIWLHGLGAGSNDFPPVIPLLGLESERAIRFIFPQAPNRPITINGGMSMPAWYDIKGMEIDDKEDLDGIRQSQNTLEQLINEQVKQGIPTENIIIAGFSQGGAVVYHTGIRSDYKLAGIMALSTYLPFATQAQTEHKDINKDIAILACHGMQDPMVPIHLGKTSVDVLTALGFTVTWKTYQMEHSVSPTQLTDIGQWINETLAKHP